MSSLCWKRKRRCLFLFDCLLRVNTPLTVFFFHNVYLFIFSSMAHILSTVYQARSLVLCVRVCVCVSMHFPCTFPLKSIQRILGIRTNHQGGHFLCWNENKTDRMFSFTLLLKHGDLIDIRKYFPLIFVEGQTSLIYFRHFLLRDVWLLLVVKGPSHVILISSPVSFKPSGR